MKSRYASFLVSRGVLLLFAGMVTAAFGVVTLLGWIVGLPRLAGFGADLIPMAPSTAVLFVLFGVALCLHVRTPLNRRAYWLSVILVCFGAMVSLLLFTLGCMDIHCAVEHLGLSITGTVGEVSIGHMSPVTALCFLLASLSFLTVLLPRASRPWITVLASGSACVLLVICFVFLLAYLYGAPLLYGGRLIPPALNTVLAFAMLGLALMALGGQSTGLFRGVPGDRFRTTLVFLLIFVLLAIGIVAAGYIHFRNYEQHYRGGMEHQLSAIAELKVGELVQWRRERMADAAIFFKNATFSALVRQFFENPADEDVDQQLLNWLEKCLSHDNCEQVCLLDAQGVTRLTMPVGLEPISNIVVQRASEVLWSGEIVIQDFYQNENNRRVYLAVCVPIFDKQPASRPLGVLVLRVDPERYLYPFIKRWPTPSPTAETLLVRKEGNEVLFLNDLRFRPDVAMNLRVPLDRINLPAAQATLGREGVTEGIDYRNVPVIAALRTIPGSPWFLVAKIDTAEVETAMRERLWQMVVTIGILLFGAGTCVGLVWRRQRVQFYRERAEAAEALWATNRALRMISNCNQSLMQATDEAALLTAICAIAVEQGGYRMAWVGLAEQDEARSVRPVAQCGFEDGYLDALNVTWSDTERGRSPVGTAIRTGEPSIARNIPTDPNFGLWRAAALQRGYASSIALPLLGEDRVCLGALAIYSAEPDAFNAEEATLLTELAGDLAYGIIALRTRAERARGEESLRRHAVQLAAYNNELTHFNVAAIGRELRMIELKKEVNELCCASGQSPRYALDFLDAASPDSPAAEPPTK